MNAFELHDRYFDPESGRISAYFSKLFILIGQESFQYCILDTERNTFIALADFRLPSPPKTTEAFFSEMLQKKYPAVVIGIDTIQHTLVPAPFFESDQINKYLEFNFGMIGNAKVCTDRMNEIDAFNVYSVPPGLLDMLHGHYSEAALFHRTTALISAIYHQQKANCGPACIYLNVRGQFIDLVYFEAGRLVYFNSFSCLGNEDIIYYTLNAIEQLKLSPDTVKLCISGMLDAGSDSCRLLEQYIRNVSYSESLSAFEYSPLLNQLPAHRYQEIYALALCGS
jgi:hypothetical protein